MKIKKIVSQHRRDFTAIYECEHTGDGYDDNFFHANVIPSMECKSCGKVAGEDYLALSTKYAEHEVI